MTDILGCRVIIRTDLARGQVSRRRASCRTCRWSGPWVMYVSTAERHRQAHLYVGAHRA